MKDHLVDFGNRLKRIRDYFHISQTDFAKQIGISNTFLCEIESGTTAPGFSFFLKVTQAVKVNPLYLLHGIEPVFFQKVDLPPSPIPMPSDTPKEESGYFGYDAGFMEDKLTLVRNSPLLQLATLQFITQYAIENESLMAAEIQKREQNQKLRAQKALPLNN